MQRRHVTFVVMVCVCLVVATFSPSARAERRHRCILPEQRHIETRPPHAIDHHALNPVPRPPTVTDLQEHREVVYLSLDDAIRKALENAEVIRVLTGTSAASSGQTIYDPAVSNTQIDTARARFDPLATSTHDFGRTDRPFADAGTPMMPTPPFIDGAQQSTRTSSSQITQTKPWGGRISGGLTTGSRSPGAVLDPARDYSLDLQYVQPLLQGLGKRANLAPIVIARIDTERSFYRLKDSVQELVRSVIEGYWGIVFARIDVWAREQQVEQLEEALRAFEVQKKFGRADAGDTAQAAVSLANFKATLIASKAALLNSEEALRNAMGLPPGCEIRFVPSTPPLTERTENDWQQLIETAHMHRPDIVESRLLLEADCQRVIMANNQALPQVDASAQYQFRGLRGRDNLGNFAGSTFGQFGDWSVGLEMELPLTLRSERAALRQAQLSLARDRANLQQQLHATRHSVARSLRNLEQFYEQYEAFRVVREASKTNLERQFALFNIGGLQTERVTVLDLLQAVTDWGNAVSSEAQSLTQYNSELANLDRQIGIILERHEITFHDEHCQSVGPCWPWKEDPCYPQATRPTENLPRYEDSGKAADDAFELESPVPKKRRQPPNETAKGDRETAGEEDNEKLPSVDELIEQYTKELEAESDAGFMGRSLNVPDQFSPEAQPEDAVPENRPDEPPEIDPRSVLPPLQLQDRIRGAAPVVPAERPTNQ